MRRQFLFFTTWACFGFLAVHLMQGQEKPKVEVVRSLPYGSVGKLYETSEPGFVYSGYYGSFQDVDLKNFVVHAFEKKAHSICGKLTGGHWEAKEDGGLDALDFSKSYALPQSDEKSKYLLVIFEHFSAYGSSDSDHYAQVWRLRDGKLAIEQQITYNTHFSDEDVQFEHFSQRDNSLQVRASHYLDHDAHCCISAYDELTFRWSGSEYVLTRIETKLVKKSAANHESSIQYQDVR